MAIRRIRSQLFSSPVRADRVVRRFELHLTLGSFFSLEIRRTTTTMTIRLPPPPRHIEHWGPNADQPLTGELLAARIVCGLLAAIEAAESRKRAREIHYYGLIGGQNQPTERDEMLKDSLGSMMHHVTGTPRTRAANQRDFDVMMKERLAKARKLREERARKKGPAVGALLPDANPLGPPPKA